jgi:hypothetical protein
MTTTHQKTNAAETTFTAAEKQKRIKAHQTIAAHLQEAVKQHQEAAKYYEIDNYKKAANCYVIATEHLMLANEADKKGSEKDVPEVEKTDESTFDNEVAR